MRNNAKKRFISGLLAGVMMLNQVPVFAAAEETGLCEHHTIHENCGYVMGIPGSPCAHEHTDCYVLVEECVHDHVDCGYYENLEENLCDHQCSEDSGCIIEQLQCVHEHDEECGYREKVTAQVCGFECLECTEQGNICTTTLDCIAENHQDTCEKKRANEMLITQKTAEFIAQGNCGEDITWGLDFTGTLQIFGSGEIKQNDDMSDYAPEVTRIIINDGITGIGESAFYNFYALTDLSLPESVTSIGRSAFNSCTNLTSVILPYSIIEIGVYAFAYSGIESIVLPEKLEQIGNGAFLSCKKLNAVTIPENVISIDAQAFRECEALKYITFKGNAPEIGSEAFWGVEAKSFYPDGDESWTHDKKSSYGGFLFWERNREPSTDNSCGEDLSWSYDPNTFTIKISGNGSMYNYDAGYDAQQEKNICTAPWFIHNTDNANFSISGNVGSIGEYAFAYFYGLSSIIIPNSITSLGSRAFFACHNLASIKFTGDAPTFENDVFSGVWQTLKITYPENNETWEHIKTLDLGVDIEWNPILMGQCGDNLVWELNDGYLRISGSGPMYDYQRGTAPWYEYRTEIVDIHFDGPITHIGDWSFCDFSNLSSHGGSYQYYQSLKSIGIGAFAYSNVILSMDGLDNLVTIGEKAFYYNTYNGSVTIPASLISIGENAFDYATGITSFGLDERNQYFYVDEISALCNKDKTTLIKFASKYLWSTYQIPETIQQINVRAFEDCTNLTDIYFGGDAPEFGDDVFANVTATVYYPANNSTWTSDVLQNYGGNLTWISYGDKHTHDYVDDICTVCGELHPRYIPLDSVEWTAKQVMSGTLYQMNLRFADASLGVTYGDNIDQFDAELRETLLQEYYKGSPAVVLVDGAYFYVGRGDGGNITYTTNGKNVYVNCEDYIDLTFKRTGEKQLTVVDSNLENLIGLVLIGADEDTSSGISCPYSETFDLAGHNESHTWTFTPQKSGQYVISLDNLDNSNYGMYAGVQVTKAGRTLAYDCSIQTKFSRYVYSLEAGTEYVIQTQYYGTDPLTDITFRIDEAVEPQGIKLEYEKLNLFYHPQREEHAYPIAAELLPWNAVGSITWESSNPDIMYAGYSEYLVAEAGYGNQPGTVIITATCGEYSDCVEVNIHPPIELELNIPYEDVCIYDQSKRYIYTAEEPGKYHIKIDSDIEYYIYADEHTPFENAGSKDWFATLEEGQFICFEIDGMTSTSNGSTYTITVNKAADTQKLDLSLKPVYGHSLQADVIFTPRNSIEEITEWEVSDESILQVAATGGPVRNWYILENGEVTITVTSESGLTTSRTVAVGNCGKYLCWMIDEEGTLTINGSGAMDAIGFDSVNGKPLQPWGDWQDRIRSVVVETGVTNVVNYAFSHCDNLEKVVIPASVTELAAGAFQSCPGLKEINVAEANRNYCSVNGVLYTKDMVTLVKYPANKSGTEFTVPDTVTKLEAQSFECASQLVSVTLPDDITVLGADTFADCTSLKSIQLPKNLTDMEAGCIFWNCSSLESIEIPDNVQVIGSSAFAYCSNLKQVTLPVGLKKLDGHAFGRCENLETITIPTGVSCLEYKIFEGSGLQSIIFEGDAPNFHEETFTDITATAYYPADNVTWTDDVMQDYGGNITWKPSDASGVCGDNLTWTFTGDTLTITGNGTMYDYSQDQVNLAPWTYLGNYIKNLVIEEGVTRIGDFAFVNCSVIEKAIFPSTLKHVGECAFYRFIQIDGNIYHKPFKSEVNQTVRQWFGVMLEANNEGFPCWDIVSFVNVSPIVASGKVGDNVYWEFSEDGTMELFGTGTMYEFGATAPPRFVELPVKDIVIGEGITTIGMNIFEVTESDSLAQTFESITIASTIKKVEEMAFTGCKALKTITFTGNAPNFGGNCFRDVKATAYYPAGNATWTSAVMQNYDGNITWVPYCLEHSFGDWITEGTNSHKTCFHCGYTEHKVVTDSGDVEIEIPEQPDLEVEVDPVLPSEDNYVLVEEVLDSTGNQNQTILKVFDINLKNNGINVQPSGTVKVKLPLDGDKDGKYKVYRVNDDGTLTDMNAYRQGNQMIFETDHFSLYVIVEETEHRHNYKPEVTAPTCTESGFTIYTCDCGDTYVGDEVAALDHNVVLQKSEAASCELNGFEYYACERCGGKEYTIILESTGHDYENGICSVCGEKDPDYVKPSKPGWGNMWDWIFGNWWGQGQKCDHEYTAVITAPTCIDKGYTTYTCSKCGDCYKDSYTNALGHAWDDGTVTEEASCTENGVRTYNCGTCEKQKKETIKATGHDYVDGICGGCGAEENTKPSVPNKPTKPGFGFIFDWIFGSWWK